MILLFFALIALSWIISSQILPLEELKYNLDTWYYKRKLSQWRVPQIVRKYITHLFNCNACISFWLILIIMSSWKLALIGYVVSAILARHLNSVSL